MKYYVHYIENSSPKIKVFKAKKTADKFVDNLKIDYTNGYWLKYYFSGTVLKADDVYKKELGLK